MIDFIQPLRDFISPLGISGTNLLLAGLVALLGFVFVFRGGK